MAERPKSQIDRFKEAAKELAANEDEAVFDQKLKRISQSKPKKDMPAKG
jgi:hypothetical protein